MSEKKFAGLYWTKEDIDSACQVYAIHIAVTNRLVCTVDTDVPSAEGFTNLFAAAPDLLEALIELNKHIDFTVPCGDGDFNISDVSGLNAAFELARAAIAKATEGK